MAHSRHAFFSKEAFLALILIFFLVKPALSQEKETRPKIPVILDTDANNEIDDQHAMAYMFLNQDFFEILGITVNATYNGGDIDNQYQEAERIADLFEMDASVPLLKGANSNFESIRNSVHQKEFDGHQAVQWIIDKAKEPRDQKLVLLAVGKLTNVALAHLKDPEIEKNVRLVWLGSNYPAPGEYNLENDIPAMNYLLETEMLFELVTVRYGDPSGTWAVSLTKNEAENNIAGRGPLSKRVITGRHGGQFNRFGDYAWDLYQHIDYYGDPPSRSLYDMAAVAIVKNPNWARSKVVKGLSMRNEKWIQIPNSQREILLWENFDREEILNDFYMLLDKTTD